MGASSEDIGSHGRNSVNSTGMSVQRRSVTMWIGTKHITPVLAAGAVAVAIAAAPTAMADPVSAPPANMAAAPGILAPAGPGGGGGHGGGGGGHGYGGYGGRHGYGGGHGYGGEHRDRGCLLPSRCFMR